MRRAMVNVLTTYDSPNSLAFLYPLLINRPFFEERGIKFRFYDRISSGFYNADAVFINSKFFKAWYIEKEKELYNILETAGKKAQKVIWFDVSDSSGTTQFNVMPFVDGYYKSQILRDKALYYKTFYGNRIFTAYYKEKFGIDDGENVEWRFYRDGRIRPSATPLKEEYAPKLRVSWNSAMNEWGSSNYASGALMARILTRLPLKDRYKIGFTAPRAERQLDITGRIGLGHGRATVTYQREMIANALKEKFGVDTSKIPRGRYLDEIKKSKIGVSPFGLGEISCRDFEVIINGALLFKQDMSHLETWPPLYTADETYMPFLWDLSDLESKLRELLKDKEKVRRISENAQRTYEYYLYGDGRMEFCNKVMDILR
ncbi:MAG: glycosyltransferase [Candidatus Omnitrophota bacterium]|nr:glycosyltransferase [Candidatus Omnitrophota bacterium]